MRKRGIFVGAFIGALGLAMGVSAAEEPTTTPTRVLIDTDPGIDDAMAILLALRSPALEVVGITTVFGNATTKQATLNALKLVELAGASVPVARGAERPLVRELREPPTFVHGEDGLGDIGVPLPKGSPVEQTGPELIVEMARRYPGQLTLVPVGPLTNLALALKMEPRLPELVERVVLMGGTARARGNVSPVAEANISGDPHAADAVFQAGWPVVMVGLDVTTAVRMPDDVLQRVADAEPKLGQFVFDMSRFYKRFYESFGVTGGFYIHDPSAVAYVIDPTLFETEPARIRVDTDGLGLGQTITAFGPVPDFWEPWLGAPEVLVCVGVDGPRFLKLYETTFSN
jgi:inosine-uridine nucleoside N-ribohydrolase